MDDEDKEKIKKKKKNTRTKEETSPAATPCRFYAYLCVRICQLHTLPAIYIRKEKGNGFSYLRLSPHYRKKKNFLLPPHQGVEKRSTVCDSDQHKLVWGCVENPVRVAYSAARMKRIRLRRTRRHVKRGKVKEEKTCLSRFGVEVLARHPSPPGNAPTWIYTG